MTQTNPVKKRTIVVTFRRVIKKMEHASLVSLTFPLLVSDVDESVLQAGAFLWVLISGQLGDQGRLARLFVTKDQDVFARGEG